MEQTHSKAERSIHERFFRITQSAYIVGFVGHTIAALMFYLLQVKELMWFNIFISVPFFLIAFFTNRKGHYSLAFSLAFTELLFHQILCVYFLGWESGFQYMLIYLAGLTFFNIYWTNWIRILLLSVVISAFAVLYFVFKDTQVYYLSKTIYDIFFISNSLGTLTSIALLINYYVQNAIRAENKLELRNDFIKKTFGRYLSDSIVSSILDTPDGLELGGEKRKVTILMSDLRGFTKISEQLPPETVLSMLNIYLKEMTEIIQKHGGTIDEFIGDAILVIFGAPFAKEDDTCRAVACALEMQQVMRKVNDNNSEKGFPEIEMGIGINTGDVVVGNIGSDKRSKYGVVGSNVNLTSRIESYTVGGQILVSEETYTDCKQIIESNDRFSVTPKGLNKPINIYSIDGLGGKYNIRLEEKLDEEMSSLKIPIDIKFSIIEGKNVSNKIFEGRIIEKSKSLMEIETDHKLELFENIRISGKIDESAEQESLIYAKVIRCLDHDPKIYRIKITSGMKNINKQ